MGGVLKSVGNAAKGVIGSGRGQNPNQGSRSMSGRAGGPIGSGRGQNLPMKPAPSGPIGSGRGLNPSSVAGGKTPPSVKFDASGKSRFQKGIGEFAPKAPAAAPAPKEPSMNANRPGKPKPSPMNANRPGAPKANSSVLSGKKPSDMLSKGGKVRKESLELEEGRAEDAKKSLEKVKKRQGVLDDYEKKTGKKLDINKSVEAREHKKNFPGAKRTGKKKRGEKESELETHNRRVNKYTERLLKYGKTKKQKKDDEAMAKHTSRFD